MKELCEEFSKVLIKRKPSTNLYSFDEINWFNGVEKTLKSRSKYSINFQITNKTKTDFFSEVNTIIKIKPEEIDSWFKEKILKLNRDNNLSIGRCQKLINMTLKYFICNYFVKEKSIINEEIGDFLINNIEGLHIPIDRIILRETYRLHRKKIEGVVTSNSEFRVNGCKCPWTNLNNYDIYEKFQYIFREISINEYNRSPFQVEFEMWNKINNIGL